MPEVGTEENTDNNIEMNLLEETRDRSLEGEALRCIDQTQPTFHRGRQLNTMMSERSVPMVYAGQSRAPNIPLSLDVEDDMTTHDPRTEGSKGNYLQQVINDFGIPVGSIYPANQTGPKFRTPSKYMQLNDSI